MLVGTTGQNPVPRQTFGTKRDTFQHTIRLIRCTLYTYCKVEFSVPVKASKLTKL